VPPESHAAGDRDIGSGMDCRATGLGIQTSLSRQSRRVPSPRTKDQNLLDLAWISLGSVVKSKEGPYRGMLRAVRSDDGDRQPVEV